MITILVIEDEEPVRANMVELLQEEGYDAIGAASGLEGIKLVWQLRPDLVICDIVMPYLDGYKVLQVLSQAPQTAAIPFIFITARADRDSQRMGMSLGADDYITKPYMRQDLLSAVKKRLEKQTLFLSQAQRQIEEQQEKMLRSLPDELFTPLGLTKNLAALLQRTGESLPIEQVQEIGLSISQAVDSALQVLQFYLFYLDLNPEKIEPGGSEVVASPLIREVLESVARLQNKIDAISIDLQQARIQISESHCSKLLEELLVFICQYMDPFGRIIVKGYASDENRYEVQLIFSVESSMRVEVIKILESTSHPAAVTDYRLTWLRMVLVHKIANIHLAHIQWREEINGDISIWVRFLLASQGEQHV